MIDDNSIIEHVDQFGPPGEAYREIIREQRKLIAELCDALEFWPYWDKEDYEYCRPLIERAREVTNDE